MSGNVLVTGATGFIGGRLAARLASSGREVRCLVRDRDGTRARALERAGFDLHEGDVLRPETLRGAGHGIDVAYYLIHSMGRGGSRDFAAGERAAASAFARMARADGIERIVYLGGLGERPHSQHLRSRHETALSLRDDGPPLTYFRAGMVVGPQSESYRTVRYLVQRLPAMIAPAWLQNATQPIAIDDTLSYLIEALTVEESAPCSYPELAHPLGAGLVAADVDQSGDPPLGQPLAVQPEHSPEPFVCLALQFDLDRDDSGRHHCSQVGSVTTAPPAVSGQPFELALQPGLGEHLSRAAPVAPAGRQPRCCPRACAVVRPPRRRRRRRRAHGKPRHPHATPRHDEQ